MNTHSIFSVTLIICSFFTIIVTVIYRKEYVKADTCINCGSKVAADGREWIGDICKKISSSSQISSSSSPTSSNVACGFKAGPWSNLDNSLVNPNPQEYSPLLKVLWDRINIIVTVAIGMTIILVLTYKYWQPCRKKCRRFSLAEIKAATGNFNHERVIGEGGFGKVYKGFIGKGKEEVAIKRLKYSSNQGEREFSMEIKILSELRHVNLVSLIGYCSELTEMILVYEYISNGTLRDHLYKKQATGNNRPFPSWDRCLNISIGAARGLNYLHTACKIIHRDVKTSNILLDENFEAKLSDFGLAKLENICESQSHNSTGVKGTNGYIDPYYIKYRELTRASDVFSFGVVLLEVLCGRPVLDSRLKKNGHSLDTWARKKIRKGYAQKIVSPNLRKEILSDSLNAFVRVAESCLDEEPNKRPTMTRVVSLLEYALELQKNPYPLATAKPSNEMDRKELTSEDCFAREVNEISVLDGPNIIAATNGFSRSKAIGRGQYGFIYKVVLRTGQAVAVELINASLSSHEFVKEEIRCLSRNKHLNLMNLLVEFSHERERILVYEKFMENRSLAAIYGSHERSWSTFLKIIIGIARGINYLHNSPLLNRGIYSNIDPCNIFLDEHMNPILAIEYGRIIKTSYYAPPEGYGPSIDRFASDMYSFGILLLDLLSMGYLSKKDLDLVMYAREMWNVGKALELVRVSIDDMFSNEEAVRIIEIAISCSRAKPLFRPSIDDVIQALDRDPEIQKGELHLQGFHIEPPQVPVCRKVNQSYASVVGIKRKVWQEKLLKREFRDSNSHQHELLHLSLQALPLDLCSGDEIQR